MNYHKKVLEDVLPIPGYEMYKITRDGTIYSYRTNKPMKTFIDKKGYERIDFRINGKRIRNLFVHRLVAITFIPNPDNLPQINHKDENKLNNCVDNLEWCDNKYNSNYGTRNKRISETRYKHYSRPVIQLTKNNEFVKEFRYVEETKKDGFQPTNIRKVLAGKRKYANGYIWKYKETE